MKPLLCLLRIHKWNIESRKPLLQANDGYREKQIRCCMRCGRREEYYWGRDVDSIIPFWDKSIVLKAKTK